jgi:N-acetylglutamate synthase-like GNAT family acetyltransferase
MQSLGNIRLAKIKDADRILSLYNSSSNLWYRKSKQAGYTTKEITEYIKDNKGFMFVFEINKLVVGVLYAEFHSDYVYLNTIVIDKKYQGQGIGHILMNRLSEEAKKKKKKSIEAITEIKDKSMQKIFNDLNYKKGSIFIGFIKNL